MRRAELVLYHLTCVLLGNEALVGATQQAVDMVRNR